MRVAILGCGYVGIALGRRLLSAGHEVVGVRRSSAGLDRVAEAGIEAVQADVTDRESLAAVPDVDAVVVAASADGRDATAARETYLSGVETAAETFAARSSPPDRLVYTSSTGVYGDHGGDWVDEQTPPDPGTERGEVLVAAEAAARSPPDPLTGTVVRFAGLYGPGRYRIERYLEGPVTGGWLNLLHRADAAGAVAHLLEHDRLRGETVVAVDDEPVDKHDLADWLAAECGRSSPPKRSIADRLDDQLSPARRARIAAQKRCSNAKLRATGYEFEYPTFRAGYRAAVEEYVG